jgi:hypothetical protein
MLAALGKVTVSGAAAYCETGPFVPVTTVEYVASGVFAVVATVKVTAPPACAL